MPAGDWNFMAARLDGGGGIEIIENELPIEIDSIESRLSAPSALSGTISNSVKRLKNGGRPVFEPWNTVILAVADDVIRGMGAYADEPSFNGANWELDVVGLSGYPQGMPFTGVKSFLATDPIDIHRYIWDYLQALGGGNVGVTLDRTTHSPVRVGTPAVDDDTAVDDSGPRVLTWWETLDLGAEIDSLATDTPYDWVERSYWGDDGTPMCRIDFGYPQIGGRDARRRLVLGENLATDPTVGQAGTASVAYILGSGEGRDRVRGQAGVYTGKVRRAVVVEDANYRTEAAANRAATRYLSRVQGEFTVSSIDVYDHPNLPLATIELGNEYSLYAETDWAEVDTFVRVVGKSEDPLQGDRATLTVVRSEVL